VEVLKALIEEAESYPDFSIKECEEMLLRLSEALEQLYVLNEPEDNDYYLRHMSGYNLSCNDGLILVDADTLDMGQRFRLIPVPGKINTYNIYTNGMYVTVHDGQNNSLALTTTPRDKWGQFIVNQVGATMFTLQSSVGGYLGTEGLIVDHGEPCVSNALDNGENIRWQLVEATNAIVDDAIEPIDYSPVIDYAVVYNKDMETIYFASDDMDILSKINVQIYTVGGRLLYTFKACEHQSVADLPSGTFIVRWMINETPHSVKLKK
jgi:hypothetical protein